jgi:ketosteroid isomerase-like protein
MSEENFEVVQQLIAALNARDVNRYLALCTPDVEYVSPAAPIEGVARGEEGLRAYFSANAEATTGFRIAVDQLQTLDGDRVLALTRIAVESRHGVSGDQPSASVYYFARAKVRGIRHSSTEPRPSETAGPREWRHARDISFRGRRRMHRPRWAGARFS